MKTEFETFGNEKLLDLYKIVFFCSRKCPAHIVLKSYDWAIEQREKGNCIISGFHSKIEKDVLHFLLKGEQSIIIALARGLKKRYSTEIKKAIEKGRLIVISPFNKSIQYATTENATKRNNLMMDIADEIFVAFATPNGNINKTVKENLVVRKKISTFDIKENSFLIKEGVSKYIIN